MDNPLNESRLRRHNSLPSKLQRRSTSLMRPTRFSNMKSNPYIGSFRHSPPTSFRSTNCGSKVVDVRMRCSSAAPLKNSPYVGWFRHAPPSKVVLHKVDPNQIELLERCHQLALILAAMPSKMQQQKRMLSPYQITEMISGSLRGGGRGCYGQKYSNNQIVKNNTGMVDSIRQVMTESLNESSSATVKVLARLGSWLLFPLAYDADQCGFDFDDVATNKFNEHFFSRDCVSDADDDSSDESSSSSDDESDYSDYSYTPSGRKQPISPTGSALDVSVSEIAEAYYAHQQVTGGLDQIHPNSIGGGLFLDESHHRLDYVITQMDIARMERNASRHLDVDSILTLPTVVYRSKITTSKAESTDGENSLKENQESDRVDEGWSWMMVQEGNATERVSSTPGTNKDIGINENAQPPVEDRVCVICLEQFIDGDKLRILPCDHSFHVGCIDRWLSGSHSHEECFTSGCPTCKKRPAGVPGSSAGDGSVPSWAFAELGSALARESAGSSMSAST